MTINKRTALRRGVTAAVFAAGLAAGAPAAIAFADDPAASSASDTKDVYVFHGTTYDEFQTVDGTRTEVVTNGPVSDLGLDSAHGREVYNDRTLSSGEEIEKARVDVHGTNELGGAYTDVGHSLDVIPASPPA